MRAVLGIDTSCYTTSCALVTPEGEILSSSRRLLTVEDGARGLMQSQGLFQHVKNLPQMVQNVMADVPDAEICAVCASTRPRPTEDSYMPVFRAGEGQARAAAALLRVPFLSCQSSGRPCARGDGGRGYRRRKTVPGLASVRRNDGNSAL